MSGKSTRIVIVALLLSSAMTLGWVRASELFPYYKTDPNGVDPGDIDNAPDSMDPNCPWDVPIDDGNGLQIGPIQTGQVVYLAFNNVPDPTRKKHFKLELKAISGSLGRVTVTDAVGFADANSNSTIPGTSTGNVNNEHTTNTIRKHYRFSKQPRWERFRLVSKSKNPVTFSVRAWSICGNYTGDWNMMLVERGGFGAEGAMLAEESVVEVQCFPESVDLDLGASPILVSHAPGSGSWSSETVFVDPEGEAMPHGGVRFVTDGAGLAPGGLFDMAFWMDIAAHEEKDVRYFIHTLDTAGAWDKYVIDLTDEICNGGIIPGDHNKDCRVNFLDYAVDADHWLECNDPDDPVCTPTDNDEDGWDSTTDCDDDDPLVNPSRPEVCGNGVDDDCDGYTDGDDEDCAECTSGQTSPCDKQEGVCAGSERICVDGMWSECDYAAWSPDYEPSETRCDGLDNDCDGEIDEGLGSGEACDTGLPGICGPGTMRCVDGSERCVADNTPGPELCDGLDNDCDESTPDGADEPLTGAACDGPDSDLCAEGSYSCNGGVLSCSDTTGSSLDLCDGIDNDCDPASVDGSEDPQAGASCDGPDSDLCEEGTRYCSAGAWSCSDTSSDDLDVCDGLDNDCDTASLDGSEDPLAGAACDGPDSDLCAEGMYSCSAGALSCSDTTGHNLDVCDGADNDCDPSSPEGSEDPQSGAACDGPDSDLCMEGTRYCNAGALSCSDTSSDDLDVCDGLDNDCDTASDDGSEDPLTGTACDGSDSDLCEEGTRYCSAGTLSCTDNTGSDLDLCDGLDNDCDPASPDGSEDPQSGAACDGPDSDLCMEGTRYCSAGALSCTDTTSDTLDVCDGLDNDCDSASPDGSEDPLSGSACDGSDSDLCPEGTYSCSAGALSCSDTSSDTLDVCDGLDNDCDPASADGSEDPQSGAACDGFDSDMCMEGTYYCSAGALSCSDTTSSDLEVCDGLDNDCDVASPDGSEDPLLGSACDGPDTDLCVEGSYHCNGGSLICSDTSGSSLDLCDGADNDCDPASPDGSEDPQYGSPCGVGECSGGTMLCEAATMRCSTDDLAVDETCDNLDNDCDGATDEDFPDKGTICSVGIGQCHRAGFMVCDPTDPMTTICDATPGVPSPEVCDGIDNDCDGSVDEGNPGGGGSCDTGMRGVCSQGTIHCQVGLLICLPENEPTPEICDGLDNDCDGAIDEGIPCECFVDEQCGCAGMPRPCETYTDPASCDIQDGCYWSPAGFCEGVREPCDFYPREQCDMQEGCYPASCVEGECH